MFNKGSCRCLVVATECMSPFSSGQTRRQPKRPRFRLAYPLHIAAEKGLVRVAELLLSRNADINVKDGLGEMPLHYVARHCRVGVVELLLKARADPNARNNDLTHTRCTSVWYLRCRKKGGYFAKHQERHFSMNWSLMWKLMQLLQ